MEIFLMAIHKVQKKGVDTHCTLRSSLPSSEWCQKNKKSIIINLLARIASSDNFHSSWGYRCWFFDANQVIEKKKTIPFSDFLKKKGKSIEFWFCFFLNTEFQGWNGTKAWVSTLNIMTFKFDNTLFIGQAESKEH